MPTQDARVDAYIRKAPPFARPILASLRETVHEACPDVVERIKWGHPSFEHHGLLCNMAAFTKHCAFGFWRHEQVVGQDEKSLEAWGSFGRLTSLADLPAKGRLKRLVRVAAKLNEEGVEGARTKRAPRAPLRMHPALRAALARNPEARRHFDAFTPGRRHEYVAWIAEAKTDATRARRIADAIAWMAQGKPRNWKYGR